MTHQSGQDMLPILHSILRKIDADSEPTPALIEFRRILIERIHRLEAIERLVSRR